MDRIRKIVLIFIFFSFIFIGLILLWILMPIKCTEKLYYIPQVEMYLKIVKPPLNKYGYVFFSKDSIFSSSEQIDYIKIYKSETSRINIIINPNIKDELYLDDRFNYSTPHAVEYKINKISFRDTTFYEKWNIAGTSTYVLKYPYMDITFEEYLRSIYVTNYGEDLMTKINPIK